MEKALVEAEQAYSRGEFPVGCVIVHNDRIIATGARKGTAADSRISETDHAEIMALKQLEELSPSVDHSQMVIYSTMEPCLMCLGAILISGIRHIVFAYEDVMGGGTRCDLSRLPDLYSSQKVTLIRNVLRNRSLHLFKRYFADQKNVYWKDSLLARYTLEAPSSQPLETEP